MLCLVASGGYRCSLELRGSPLETPDGDTVDKMWTRVTLVLLCASEDNTRFYFLLLFDVSKEIDSTGATPFLAWQPSRWDEQSLLWRSPELLSNHSFKISELCLRLSFPWNQGQARTVVPCNDCFCRSTRGIPLVACSVQPHLAVVLNCMSPYCDTANSGQFLGLTSWSVCSQLLAASRRPLSFHQTCHLSWTGGPT